jgi:hypothetical protein
MRKHSMLDQSWSLPVQNEPRHFSIVSAPRNSLLNGLAIPKIVLDLADEAQPSHPTHEGPYLESGKFFMDPDLTEDEDEKSKI